jgi:putative sigma-54 modulation protein
MNVNVSYRQMESSPALRDYATRKLERIVDKYVRGRAEASIVMTAEGFGHIVDFTLSVKDATVKGKAQSQDMYSSIDLALEKIEKQLRRRKDRKRDHHNNIDNNGVNGMARSFRMGIVAPVDETDGEVEYEEFAEDYEKFPAPDEVDGEEDVVLTRKSGKVKVVRNHEYTAEPMTIEEAASELDDGSDREFFVFNNVETDTINIVYRRDDDHIGLIETG